MIKTTWLSRMRRSLGEYSPSSSRLRVVKDRSRGRHRESLKILLLSFHKIVEGKSQVLIVHLAKVLNFTFRVTEGALWQGADKISLHDFSTFLILSFLIFWLSWFLPFLFFCLHLARKYWASSCLGEYQAPFLVWQKTAQGSQEPCNGRNKFDWRDLQCVGIHVFDTHACLFCSLPLTVGGEPACPSPRDEGKEGVLHKPRTFKVEKGV